MFLFLKFYMKHKYLHILTNLLPLQPYGVFSLLHFRSKFIAFDRVTDLIKRLYKLLFELTGNSLAEEVAPGTGTGITRPTADIVHTSANAVIKWRRVM
jgi:hypothetical protein